MKVAIFFDWLNQWGGAERVLLDILKIYPEATVFTLVHDQSQTSWLPTNVKIVTSFINRLPFAKGNPIFYTPLYDIALEQFNFSGYNLVISTTSVVGHCLITPPETLFVTYFHNINRHLYKHRLLKPYQKIDYLYSRRPDAIFCNSQTVSHRIANTYQLSSQIINPGIDNNFFVPSPKPNQEYFLIVSRLVAHKKVDLVINVFRHLSDRLIIVGTGRDLKKLKGLAGACSNIKFVGKVSDTKLKQYYQNCRALICPQLEDFGLSAIEAQACGKPVIAYGRGGNTETIIDGQTGVFFEHQTQKSLLSAINKFKKSQFSPSIIRQHSLTFSHQNFMLNFKQSIDRLWIKHQNTTF